MAGNRQGKRESIRRTALGDIMASETLLYAQGQTATITALFVTSPAGMPIDVPDATIQITGPGASVVLAPTAMTHVMTGFYFYDYAIPNSLPVNTYTVLISGTVLGVPTAMSIYMQVVAAGTTTPVSASQRTAELIAALETYVGCAQRVPVYNEVPRRNPSSDIWRLTWPRWNLGNHEVRLNNELIDTGFTMNLDSATLTFTRPLHPSDKLLVSYNFRMFSQIDMIRFLTDALSQMNLEPPGTGFTLDTVPDTYVGVLMMGAAKNAIKHMLFCLAFQEPATIFGGPDRVKDAISTFQSLKENNEKEFERDKKQIKKAVYPRIGAIVAPEFTLPGGRSRWFRYLFSSGIG
jgi:hypothetical protein